MRISKSQSSRRPAFETGNITYNDGFSDTSPQHWDFCFQTFYNPKSKTDVINICEPSSEIPKLMKSIEYPKNEDHSDP